MFGRRNDGVNVAKELDPIVLFTPFIMPTRCESMNNVIYPAEYQPMADYIRNKRDCGHTVSFLTIMAAAYVRTVRRYPVMNRFVIGKKIFKHNDISMSLIVLQDTEDGSVREEEIKVHCEPTDDIFTVAKKFDEKVAEAKKPAKTSGTSNFARVLLGIPLLPNFVVLLCKIMDRLGILPKALNELSPFHCSLFITNMMSIGLPAIHHHLYNFGTCSIFLSFGRPERQTVTVGGKATRRLVLPLGIVTDERICGGVEYARGVHTFLQYLQHPEVLELTVEEEDLKLAGAAAQ